MEDTMGQWSNGSNEPSLDELFAEPIVQLLMKRDGVHAREMQHELHRSQQRATHTTPRF